MRNVSTKSYRTSGYTDRQIYRRTTLDPLTTKSKGSSLTESNLCPKSQVSRTFLLSVIAQTGRRTVLRLFNHKISNDLPYKTMNLSDGKRHDFNKEVPDVGPCQGCVCFYGANNWFGSRAIRCPLASHNIAFYKKGDTDLFLGLILPVPKGC
ncbi:hypothetical protein J6590_038896 [Homalodisca vitripennis]|nr:hypothetical protein J6590_038896 [Homalodisca vitripennis]